MLEQSNFKNDLKQLIKETNTVIKLNTEETQDKVEQKEIQCKNNWENKLKDIQFIDFLNHYYDDKNNNIYHILLKSRKLNSDAFQFIGDILNILLKYKISIYHFNSAKKLPSDYIKNNIQWHALLKEQEHKEFFKIQEQTNEQDWQDLLNNQNL